MVAYNNTNTFQKGKEYLQNNQIEDAIECFTACIDNNDQTEEAYFQRSLAFMKTNSFSNAMNDLIALLEINPSNGAAKSKLEMIKTILDYRYIDRLNV